MKKENFFKYLLFFILANILSIVFYYAVISVLNIATGGGYAIFSGAQEMNGWTADDLSPALKIIISLVLILTSSLMFTFFYIFMYIFLKRNLSKRDAFLHEIGSGAFDKKSFATQFIRSGAGKRELIYFSVIVVVGVLCLALKFPPIALIMSSQIMPARIIMLFFPMSGMLYEIISAVLILIISIVSYYCYLKFIVPRVYEKWANARLRVD